MGSKKKKDNPKPLSSTGEIHGPRTVTCGETWDASRVKLEDVRESWTRKYHPNGYNTTVKQIGGIEDGVLRTVMTRYSSCD